jgi:hypothetical protein
MNLDGRTENIRGLGDLLRQRGFKLNKVYVDEIGQEAIHALNVADATHVEVGSPVLMDNLEYRRLNRVGQMIGALPVDGAMTLLTRTTARGLNRSQARVDIIDPSGKLFSSYLLNS